MGTILSPVTLELITCAPSVGLREQPLTEHSAGHDLPEKVAQCCAQEPHLHDRSPVPTLFFHPTAVMLIFYVSPFALHLLNIQIMETRKHKNLLQKDINPRALADV